MACKLSVIVPIYNVEPFLKRCIDSILSQDYTDFELILIDDGSPDNCGKICDEYAKKYSQIVVIHQNNKGLAETRNVGICVAKGEYLSFIDSDDYIMPGTYSRSMELIEKNNIDIFCFQHFDVYNNEEVSWQSIACVEELKMFSTEEAFDALFYPNYINVITCNKIIKKSLFNGISFPSGKLYEDMFTTYKYLINAKRIMATNQRYYIYCHREGSIGTQKYSPGALKLVDAAQETYDFAIQHFPAAPNLLVGLLFWKVVVANMMIRGKCEEKSYIRSVQELGRKNVGKIIRNPYWNVTRKIELLLFSFSLPFYKIGYFMFRKWRQ